MTLDPGPSTSSLPETGNGLPDSSVATGPATEQKQRTDRNPRTESAGPESLQQYDPRIGSLKPEVTRSQCDLYTEDLGAFYIISVTTCGVCATVDELKDYFSGNPALQELVGPMIGRMEEADLIEVDAAGKIKPLQKGVNVGNTAEALKRYVPQLMKKGATKILEHCIDEPDTFRSRKELLHYWAIPDTADAAHEALHATIEYRMRMQAIMKKYIDSEDVRGTRLYGVMAWDARPEDFE